MSIRIDELSGQTKDRIIEIKKVNEEEQREMFSIVNTALNPDEECKKLVNMTRMQVIEEIRGLKEKTLQDAEKLIPYFKENAKKDIDLLFDTVFMSIMPFTMYECFEVYKKILSGFERILGIEPKFYSLSKQEKEVKVEDMVTRFIPVLQMQYYMDFIQAEKSNPFSIYNEFIEKVRAQDYIIRGDFISIQYDNNGNFLIVKFPDFLKEINKRIVNHMVINFTYQQTLQFGPSNAILDLEALGYRFNIIHSSLDTEGQTSLFIRKNVAKGDNKENIHQSFDFASYYYGLFSELPDTEELVASIMEHSEAARKKLAWKFDGFASKNFVDTPYCAEWFATRVAGGLIEPRVIDKVKAISIKNEDWDELSVEEKMEITKWCLIDLIKNYVSDKNPLIVGPTGSGKSTLLAKILTEKQETNPEQNLITIEDTPELHIPYCISYVTNKKYKIHDVFVASLRENPSRVLIGETRGYEIIDILETCLTAKSGTTCHATDFPKLEQRLKLMVGDKMATDDLFRLTVAGIDIIVFIVARKVTGVYIRNSKPYSNGGTIKDCYERIM